MFTLDLIMMIKRYLPLPYLEELTERYDRNIHGIHLTDIMESIKSCSIRCPGCSDVIRLLNPNYGGSKYIIPTKIFGNKFYQRGLCFECFGNPKKRRHHEIRHGLNFKVNADPLTRTIIELDGELRWL